MVAVAPPTYTRSDWQAGYRSFHNEGTYWIDSIQGSLPTDLRGTLFRNGPGKLDVNGQRYGHPFDGDGLITAISFLEGRVHVTHRYVQTPELQAEQKAGRILYRGVFGTQKPGGWWANCFDLKFKNPANTNVIYHGGKLLALWEAAPPYRLDPSSLKTLGIETFAGALDQHEPFTAHPRIDPSNGDLISFGVRSGLNTTLSFFRITSAGAFVEKTEHEIPGFAFLHDFVWTPHYRIFFQNPISFNPIPFALGFQTAGACLKMDPQAPTRIWIFGASGEPTILETDPGFVFHFVNGFELTNPDRIVIDLISYGEYPALDDGTDYLQVNFDQVPPGQLMRFELDLAQKTVQRRQCLDRSVEFPAIHPRTVGHQHRYLYLGTIHDPNGNAPLQALIKLDTETGQQSIWSFAPTGFIGEPVLVPRPGGLAEDEGWLISIVFDAAQQRSVVMILDAQDLEAGPIAQVPLRDIIPYGLHGSFTPEIFITDPA